MYAELPYYFHIDNLIFKTCSLSLGHSHHPQRRNHAAHFFLQILAPRSVVSMDFLLLAFHINATIYWKKNLDTFLLSHVTQAAPYSCPSVFHFPDAGIRDVHHICTKSLNISDAFSASLIFPSCSRCRWEFSDFSALKSWDSCQTLLPSFHTALVLAPCATASKLTPPSTLICDASKCWELKPSTSCHQVKPHISLFQRSPRYPCSITN